MSTELPPIKARFDYKLDHFTMIVGATGSGGFDAFVARLLGAMGNANRRKFASQKPLLKSPKRSARG